MHRLLVLALALPLLLASQLAAAFGFDDVAALARQDAAAAYQAPVSRLPQALASLDYDGRRDIRFRPDHALWRGLGLPFELQFFHLSGGNDVPVAISEVVDGQARAIAYDAADWDFGRNRLDPGAWGDLGVAGLRVHYALNAPAYKDELVVFLGASYFRALGRGQQYGLSARGLALDTVGGSGEEFPRFKAFWIERPAPGATAIVIYAQLDSARATGAYRFVVTPGDETVVDVQARVFARETAAPVQTWCLAPLTSMFLHGENQPDAGDFRPEVHDSDGLMVAAGSAGGATEWLWRPLANPPAPLASSFAMAQLRGFGLMQRDRRFAAYEDTEARYERRPSAWVEPVGDWGAGRVQLLELPAPDETHDNIVACWAPQTPPTPAQPLDARWRLHWQGDAMAQPPVAATVQSRRGHGWGTPPPGELQFIVDFDGPALRALPADAAVDAVATAVANAELTDARAWPHPLGGWRLQLRVHRLDPARPTELRAFLRRGNDALTETWSALIPPEVR